MKVTGYRSVLLLALMYADSSAAAPRLFSGPRDHRRASGPRRNLVFMISDGFGVASEAMARAYVQKVTKQPEDWLSNIDDLLVGSTRTRSSSSLVTDSGAGATAFSCAKKSYNGAIGVTANGKPCGTILEAAKLKGYTTGLVTTSRITHATPASFAAHVKHREMEDLIAEQEIGKNALNNRVDLLFGGGMCHFRPRRAGEKKSCREDNTDVWRNAGKAGYTTIENKGDFDALASDAKLPIIGLFSHGHMAYDMDRDDKKEPALSDMTKKALEILDANTQDTGFFLMVEGARIDMAGHDNDPVAHLHDIIQYWKTVQVVREFVATHPDTALVSTSDHETGGLSLALDPEYLWYPGVLSSIKRSAEAICADLKDMNDVEKAQAIRDTVLTGDLGFPEYLDIEVDTVLDGALRGSKKCKQAIGHVVSRRAHLSWTTTGHSGSDVGLYAYGNGTEAFKGSLENTKVGEYLANYLGVELDEATRRLQDEKVEQRYRNRVIDDYH